MSGIHQKSQPPPHSGGGSGGGGGASIPVDTLWNIGINVVLLGCILVVGWMCYRAFKRYVLFRISQWTSTSPRHARRSDDDDDDDDGGAIEEEEPPKKSNLRYRK